MTTGRVVAATTAALAALVAQNKLQRMHALLRNHPVLGYARYGLEKIRPEIRQYFVEPWALSQDGPVLLDVLTNPVEIAVPPQPTRAQGWGFAIAKVRETLESA